MEHERIRELADVFRKLENEDVELLTAHLPTCADCRERLIVLEDAAEALKHARVTAPPELRGRVLERVRHEQLRTQRLVLLLAAAAGVVGVAALGLGIWAYSLSEDLADEGRSADRAAALLLVLTDAEPSIVPITGADGSLVTDQDGQATLVISGLREAPGSRTYQAWVLRDETPIPAGLFEGGETTVHALTARALPGSVVLATIEPAGGSRSPTGKTLFEAKVGG